ncbi:MAG: serine/threonine-protein kinase [Sandaracinaceae bacterium]
MDRSERGEANVLAHLARCRVLGRLGSGGMAEVFLLEHGARRVALKRMHRSLARQPDQVAMFLHEARVFMRTAHPYVVRFYGAARVDGVPCVAMEHVEGVTLEVLLARAGRYGGIPVDHAVAILADVAAALDWVHQLRDERGHPLQIVHRDVTPKNIMIGFDGRVRLLDFGIAKSTQARAQTRPGMTRGVLSYLPPEVFLGQRCGPAGDQFSLGVCLFEALTGRPLYRFARAQETREAIVAGPVPSLTERCAVRVRLDAVVRRALAKTPKARFTSAGELSAALRDQLSSTPDLAALTRVWFAVERQRPTHLDPTAFGARWPNEPPRVEPMSIGDSTAHEVVAAREPTGAN